MRKLVATVSALVTLTACQAAPSANQTPIGSAVPTAWNVTTWKPSTPYTAPVVPEGELMARRAAMLQRLAKDWGLSPTPPDPGLVRFIAGEEVGRVHSECLRGKGWNNMTPNPDGTGMRGDEPPESQKQAYNLAHWQCVAMYTVDQRFDTATPALLTFLWEYKRDYLIPCLHAHGLKETEPLPSKEQFIALGGNWNGYPIQTARDEVQRACPQNPPAPPL